ncbi:MAG: helix-turn-helix domain-containing protein [Candidatus Hadarchaeales archaeon]
MREYLREGRDVAKMRWWCVKKHGRGWSGDKISAHLGVPRSTAYYWINKYIGCDKEEMGDRPRDSVPLCRQGGKRAWRE